jgi:hypothetical protein
MPAALYVVPGAVFGRWTVSREVARGSHGRRRHECHCSCGRVAVVSQDNLVSGVSTSCGCRRVEVTRARQTKHGESHRTAEHRIWKGLVRRCTKSSDHAFRHYGGRGITVCERWRSDYRAFLADVGRRPAETAELDRIDNDRGYEPGNVRWTDRRTQTRNTRANRRLTIDGITLCVSEWAERSGVSASAIFWRLDAGWSAERAVFSKSMSRDEVCARMREARHTRREAA